MEGLEGSGVVTSQPLSFRRDSRETSVTPGSWGAPDFLANPQGTSKGVRVLKYRYLGSLCEVGTWVGSPV